MGELLFGEQLGSAAVIERRLTDHQEIIEDLAAEGQLLYVAAQAKVDSINEAEGRSRTLVEPDAMIVYNTLVTPPKEGESAVPRYQLIQGANAAIKQVVETHGDDILAGAAAVGMRRTGNFAEREELSRLDLKNCMPLHVIEGGANKTSIVRRGVMLDAGRAIDQIRAQTDRAAGKDMSHRMGYPALAYQLGSDARKIAPESPEHKVIRELTGDYFAEDQTITELEANIATAIAAGYPAYEGFTLPAFGYPKEPGVLFHLQSRGLVDGLGKISADFDDNKKPNQFVIATNGQYRPKSELMVAQWALENDVSIGYPVAIGDEPGDRFAYRSGEIVVPTRPAMAYLNELAIYGRLLHDRTPLAQGQAGV